MQRPAELRIAVVGLGYVGLPLAVEFGRILPTLGFDINAKRVTELAQGRDSTREFESGEFASAAQLSFSSDAATLQSCNVFIIAVPTPIDAYKQPDLGPLMAASQVVADALSVGDTVIFESTVFPGCTEDVCVPILEQRSGLTFNTEFFVGYSPERINPGDKMRGLADVVKVTSGSTAETADFVDGLYAKVVKAGTHKVSSIRVAEAAKVIENTQRDVNIALVNELALLFNRLGLDTHEVLEAAGTKWNFLPFKPGMVGGHCIGVDPFYLTYKAREIGFEPRIILAGRSINDEMGFYVARRVIKLMTQKSIQVTGSRVLVMGFAFKEDCPDFRNTRVTDIIHELQEYNADIAVYDPWVDAEAVKAEYGFEMIAAPEKGHYDAIILAVAHSEFRALGVGGVRALGRPGSILFDVKAVLPRTAVDGRL